MGVALFLVCYACFVNKILPLKRKKRDLVIDYMSKKVYNDNNVFDYQREDDMELTKKKFSFRRNIDMTQGSIALNILRFAFPLLLGNLFQQLYSMVDTWVIGQTGNDGAYAAVGSVGPVINVLIGFFLGLSSGAGVIISQYYGAKNEKRVNEVVHTAMALTAILAVIFTVLGILITPHLLTLMLSTEEGVGEVYPHAKTYLAIYFAGVSGLMFYNIGAGILRAIGDSFRPFIYLVVASITNIILDLVFVFWFDMGASGVALATVIAQGFSALLTIITLMRTSTCVRFSFRKLHIDTSILKKIFVVGIPAGVQMAITSFSNMFVTRYIGGANGVQQTLLSGWTTYTKIDQFIFLPMQSISLAATTFVGQNLGGGDEKRAKKGTYTAYFMATCVTAVLIVIIMIFAPYLAAFFNDTPDVVDCATLLLHYITPFYMFCCINQVFSASLRGAGRTGAPMIIMLVSFVAFRQIYLFLVSTFISNELIVLAFGYPMGWGLCALLTLIYYKKVGYKSKQLVEKTA